MVLTELVRTQSGKETHQTYKVEHEIRQGPSTPNYSLFKCSLFSTSLFYGSRLYRKCLKPLPLNPRRRKRLATRILSMRKPSSIYAPSQSAERYVTSPIVFTVIVMTVRERAGQCSYHRCLFRCRSRRKIEIPRLRC